MGVFTAVAGALLLSVGMGASKQCVDTNNMCFFWSQSGECEKNPNYMHVNCALSCGKCTATQSVSVDADGAYTAPLS